MIYTVTLNPCLDNTVTLPDFHMGQTNRVTSEKLTAGGKGINVAIVLHRLGIPVKALGFVAGCTGQMIENALCEEGLSTDFIHLAEGASRINIKMKTDDGTETEIGGIGPAIPPSAWEELKTKLQSLQDGDTLVLSGSIPASLPKTAYGELADQVKNKNIRVIVDSEGEALLVALSYHPYLIKPNHRELGDIFGVEIDSFADAERYAKKLQNMGAANILVSMGDKGALLLAADGTHYTQEAKKGKLVSSVGAGDSMIAGFLAGKMHKLSDEDCLRLAVSCGSATAFSDGLATKEAVYMAFITE